MKMFYNKSTKSSFSKLKIFYFFLFFILIGPQNSYCQYTLQDSLVAYYPFYGNANDLSGNGNHGTVNGATLINNRFGNPNNAYSFDGSNDYIGILFDNTLSVGNERTVAFWLYPNTWDGTAGILCQAGSEGNQILAEADSSIIWEMYKNGVVTNINSDSDFVDVNQWQFFTIVMKKIDTLTNVKFYKNGNLFSEDTMKTEVANNTTDYYIGTTRNKQLNYFYDGILDDLRIYNRLLSLSEIQQLFNISAYSGPVWHVSIAGNDTIGDGSPSNPFATIQYAIDVSVYGDTVLVHPGTYIENINFNGKKIVVGSEFITTNDTGYVSQTIIDGNNNGSVVTFKNGEDSTTFLSGFTITNGSGTYVNHAQSQYFYYGGGIFCEYASPVLSYLIIKGNSVISGGLGNYGGGINCFYSSPYMEHLSIKNNTSSGSGGGINFEYYSFVTLENVIISNNTADVGGALQFLFSDVDLLNVEITKNISNSKTISLETSNPVFTNVTIANNMASGTTPGIFCKNNSNPVLKNCILWNNSILPEVSFLSTWTSNSITVSYSDVRNGISGISANNNGTVSWQAGNISSDPLFVDAINGNFELYPGSPCINTGDTSGMNVPLFDLAGNQRIIGDTIDIGAYENIGCPLILSNPVNQSVCINNTVSFQTSATGFLLNYQWQKDGMNISGATNNILQISPVAESDTGFYKCIISNFCDTIHTDSALLIVTLLPKDLYGNYCPDTLTDSRDGQKYPTIKVDGKCWMAKNLNFGTRINGVNNQTNNSTIEKYCYNDIEDSCNVYGGLYQWNEMMQYSTQEGTRGICPKGWHVPTDNEWCKFTSFIDNTVNCGLYGATGLNAGGYMKETGTTHWNMPNAGATNSSGFSALPCGNRDYYNNGSSSNMGVAAYFWSSTELNSVKAWKRDLYFATSYVYRTNDNKLQGFSLRCLKDSISQLGINYDDTACSNNSMVYVKIINPQSEVRYHLFDTVYSTTVGNPVVGSNNDTITFSFIPNSTVNYYQIITTDTVTLCSRILDTTVVISIITSPVINLGNDTIICQNDSLVLDPGSGFASYFWQDGNTAQTRTVKTSGSFWVNVTDNNGCTSTDSINITLSPSYSIIYNDTICQGDSLLIGNIYQIFSGIYYDTLNSIYTCDSVIITNLLVLQINTTFIYDTICQGDSILAGGDFQNTEGIYYDTLQGFYSCDSIIITDLTITPVQFTYIYDTICQSDSIFAGGTYQDTAGVYLDTLAGIATCDSIIVTNLTVFPVYNTIHDITICFGDSVLAGGGYQNLPGSYYDTITSILACDSIIITNLTIAPLYSLFVFDTICHNDSVFLEGAYQNIQGIYFDSLLSLIGCDSIRTTFLTVLPVSSIMLYDSICEGDSVFTGGSYKKSAGIYYDTLYSVYTCDSIVITELTVLLPSYLTLYDSVCYGDSVFVGGAYQSTTGLYYDTLFNTLGCDSIIITDLTVIPELIVDAGLPIIIGSASTVSLNATVTGGSGHYRYDWTPAALLNNPYIPNPITVTLFSSVIFNLTVQDTITGCIGTSQVIVTVLSNPLVINSLNATSTNICLGDSSQLNIIVSGGTGNYNYSWTSDPAGFISNIPNPIVTPINTTIYSITVSDGVFTLDSNITINVGTIPYVNVEKDTVVCKGDSVILSANSNQNVSYSWNTTPVQNTQQIIVNPNTTTLYKVLVSNIYGCIATDSATVTVFPIPVAVITPLGPTAICIGDSVVLSTNTGVGYTYKWFHNGVIIPGVSSFVYTAFLDGTYSVVLTNTSGCIDTSALLSVTTTPVPNPQLGGDTTICYYDTLILNPGIGFNSYLWSNGSANNVLVVTSNINNLGPKSYSVTVTDNGCSASDNIIVTFDACTGFEENSEKNSISLFPNPNNGKFTIKFENDFEGDFIMKVFDVLGTQVKSEKLNKSGYLFTNDIEVTTLPPGIYLLSIEFENRRLERMFVVK